MKLKDGVDLATAFKEAQLSLRYLAKSEMKAYLNRFDEETSHDHVMTLSNYIKGRSNVEQMVHQDVTPRLEVLLNQASDDDRILAEYPYYWAPYILIGDPDSVV